MTLQELHELTGKVLKERPELAKIEILLGTECDLEYLEDVMLIENENENELYLRGFYFDREKGILGDGIGGEIL